MKRILTTLYLPRRAAWTAQTRMIDRRTMPRLRLFRHLVSASGGYRALVLNGAVGPRAGYVDLAVAALVTRRRAAPLVVLAECTWKVGRSRVRHPFRRLAVRVIDNPNVVYCVPSSEERELFPRTWNLTPSRVVFTPFCHSLTEEELEAGTPGDDGFVFAAGNSLRDYGPLIEAARSIAAEVVIATDAPLEGAGADLPPNVDVRALATCRFTDLLRRARVVVVPMVAGLTRSAGLLTYLSAMALGKAVIVTEAPGVRDYVSDRETGFIVPPEDARALTATLGWILDPVNEAEVRRIEQEAEQAARTRFGPDSYVAVLLDIVERFAPRDGRPGAAAVAGRVDG